MRPHVAAVYAFARKADDLADEGNAPAAERLDRLHAWRDRLHEAVAEHADRSEYSKAGVLTPAKAGIPTPADHDAPIFIALAHSIRMLDLPLSLFDDLVSAFGQDTMTTRYASWAEVFDYCRRSAQPVGRLVLRIAGYHDEALDRSSDALCTALQLTNFWQDFGRDWRSGRLYVPRDVSHAAGAREADLMLGRMTAAWMDAIEECVVTTRGQFQHGRGVCDHVRGRLRMELRLTWLGGQRILDRVERTRATLLTHRPTLGSYDVPPLLWRAIRWGGRAA